MRLQLPCLLISACTALVSTIGVEDESLLPVYLL
jgi:hypothetical protein